jgi:hypothetical protein
VEKIKQPHGGAIARAKKGESGNPNGRPRKVFSQLSKEWTAAGIERATRERIREVYESLLGLTLLEVRDIAGRVDDESNHYPAIVRLAAKEMTGKRGIEILREMLDRAHGKAGQSIDHQISGNLSIGGEVDHTPEQAAKILAAIRGEL